MNLLQEILNPPDNLPPIFGVVNLNPPIDTAHKNTEIQRVYTTIIKDLREQLSKMNSIRYRSYLMRSYPNNGKMSRVICEFICVLCELRLSVRNYCYYIELETDSDLIKVIGDYHYRNILRAAYRVTMWENTIYNIEDCITIRTNLYDHYSYFKNKLKEGNSPDCLLAVEEP